MKALLIVLCGGVIGFINGFMGAGGGMLLVPVLFYICKLETKKAHATAVLVILPLCVASGIIYILKNAFDFAITLPVGIGTIAGGVVGTFLLKKLKSDWISLIFYLVMIGAGIKLIV